MPKKVELEYSVEEEATFKNMLLALAPLVREMDDAVIVVSVDAIRKRKIPSEEPLPLSVRFVAIAKLAFDDS